MEVSMPLSPNTALSESSSGPFSECQSPILQTNENH